MVLRMGKGEILVTLRDLDRKKASLRLVLSKAKAAYRNLEHTYPQLIQELQTNADDLARRFRECYEESRRAFADDDGALAKALSLEGRTLQHECEQLNARANTMRTELKDAFDHIQRTLSELKSVEITESAFRKKLEYTRKTRVLGFNGQGDLDSLAVERILDGFPQAVFAHVALVRYVPDLVQTTPRGLQIPARGKTAWDAADRAVVEIGNQRVRSLRDLVVNYSMAIAHELGHVVYENISSDHQKAEWFALCSTSKAPISLNAIDEIEEFAEAFVLLHLQPDALKKASGAKYAYMKVLSDQLTANHVPRHKN